MVVVVETATKLHVSFAFGQVQNPLCLPRKRHPNVQKCSEPSVFLHTWLRNVLRATTVCTFSTSQLPKVVRDRQFLTLLTLKCASRHNGVHFFDISTSKSAPKLRCFVHFDFEMCFVPQRPAIFHLSSGQMAPAKAYFSTRRSHKSLEKHSESRLFYLFAHLHLSLSLHWSSLFCSSLLWLCPPLLFHLSILTEVWLLNFLRSYMD